MFTFDQFIQLTTHDRQARFLLADLWETMAAESANDNCSPDSMTHLAAIADQPFICKPTRIG